jgi:hypothetical protein
MDPAASVQYVTLPSSEVLEVVYSVTFGEVLIASTLALGIVLWFGSKLLDRLRGAL